MGPFAVPRNFLLSNMQNEVRQITHQVVEAMEEAEKQRQAQIDSLFLTDRILQSIDLCHQILLFLAFYSLHCFTIFCGGKKTYCVLTECKFL